MPVICRNGDFIPSNLPAIKSTDRSYRYGAGLFETIKIRNGEILHFTRHLERLFRGIAVLQLSTPLNFTPGYLQQLIITICRENKTIESGRVRLSISAGDGGLAPAKPGFDYIIESGPLEIVGDGIGEPVNIGIYPGARKSRDIFSNLKSSSFLPYFMAAAHANTHGWADAIVLNNEGRIADTSIANVFIIRNKAIVTPALAEGCVSGIIRGLICDAKSLLDKNGFQLVETRLTQNELEDAEEIFLTNAIRGIIPVKKFGNKIYTNHQTTEINNLLTSTISP